MLLLPMIDLGPKKAGLLLVRTPLRLSAASRSSAGSGPTANTGYLRKRKCSESVGALRLIQFGSVSKVSLFSSQESSLCASTSPREEVPGTPA